MNSNKFLPFSLPEIGEEEINEVIESLRSGWVTTGPKTKRFEEDFSEFIGSSVEAIAVNSATAGLHLALEALGVGEGDEVIVPTYTFTATAEIVRYLGATPIFVDSLGEDFNISPALIEKSITKNTRVIIPVHFAGRACNMAEIWSLASKYNLKVLEDAAHALPCSYAGEQVGSSKSDAVVFSFYANKTMTTGEGGMIVTKSPDIARRCRTMRLHGISRDAFDRYTSSKPAWFYEVVAPGFKYNMPDIAAAMGIHQLKKLPSFQKKRELMAQKYDCELLGLPITLPVKTREGDLHGHHIYPILLNENAGIDRDEFIMKMADLGIGCSVHFIPLHLQPYWREQYLLTPDMFPVAQGLFEREISIPLYTKMTAVDQDRVIVAIKAVLAHD